MLLIFKNLTSRLISILPNPSISEAAAAASDLLLLLLQLLPPSSRQKTKTTPANT
jgi:hypothetical protein